MSYSTEGTGIYSAEDGQTVSSWSALNTTPTTNTQNAAPVDNVFILGMCNIYDIDNSIGYIMIYI